MTAPPRRVDAPALSRRALLAAALLSPLSHALGRRPYGGVVVLELPFGIDLPDPHRAGSWSSAFFAPAIADPLFAWDTAGAAYPALAASLPSRVPDGCRVTLRRGLVTARGRQLDARDVVASLVRARGGAGRPLLASVGTPRVDPTDPLSVLFRAADPDALADALSSPTTAILSRSSREGALDGTGAFRPAFTRTGVLSLERNEHAARGPSFLDRIEVRRAADLASALRSFESGDADVGFLGAGLHRKRPGAVPFRTPPGGFVVLRSGQDAKSWGAPGVAAGLVAAMDPGVLSHLGLTLASSGDTAAWGGDPSDVLVDERSAYLVEVARVVATVLSRPGHELRPLTLSQTELQSRLNSGRYALAVDFVRRVGPTPRHTLLSLLAAVDPRLADNPPRLTTVDIPAITRTLPLAVLGELSLAGAVAPEVHDLDAWDLGSAFRRAP